MNESQHKLLHVALNAPHLNGIYCYLYLHPKVDAFLNVIPEFNTFNEINTDLELIKGSLWFLSTSKQDSNFICYSIRGNGFLYKETK